MTLNTTDSIMDMLLDPALDEDQRSGTVIGEQMAALPEEKEEAAHSPSTLSSCTAMANLETPPPSPTD